MDRLKQRTVIGLLWSMLDKGGQQLIILCTGIWLARILVPEDYGMIAVLSIYTYLGNALQESGFTAAIIRKERLTNNDLDVVFYMNVGIGVTVYVILLLCSPLLSSFYENAELQDLSKIVFLMFLFNAFSVVQNAILIREMKFKRCTIINTTSILLSYTLALVLANRDAGPYAIAVQSASLAFFRMIFLWLQSSWRPHMTFKRDSFHTLFSFSFKMLLTNILNTTACRLFPSVIGKFYTTIQAGYYEQAQRWGNMPQDFIAGTISNVTFPAISEVRRDDTDRLRHVFRKTVRVTAFIVLPLFVLIMVCANTLISYAIKPQWLPLVPFLLFICTAGIFNGFNTANYNMLKSTGESDKILKYEIIRNVLTIVSIVICVPIGVYWMMGAMVVISVANYIIFSNYVDRILKIRWVEHLMDLIPYIALVGVAGGLAYPLESILSTCHPLIILLSQVLTVLVIYLGGGYLFGSTILGEAIQILKKRGCEN